MECYTAILLFDGFSERKQKQSVHWSSAICFVLLTSTVLNLIDPELASFVKIIFAIAGYYILYLVLYKSSYIFGIYATVIYYAAICCIDNLCSTFLFLFFNESSVMDFSGGFLFPFLMHCLYIATFYIYKKMRKEENVGTASWKWYTIPALLSVIDILLIFFFANCFRSGQMSALPLFVSAVFITFMQMAALFLVSWLEQDANFREETLSLQTKAQAQQESIEALSAAYAQQRKFTHDFHAHLDTITALLAQKPLNVNALQEYIHDLQSVQTNRILLVSTHHAALDALLNQKALLALNRKIDIQFTVNNLSAVKINAVDLTIVISNTLDNAIEACEKLAVGDRQIFVKVLLDEDELFYAVRNRSLPVDVPLDRLPTTTKIPPSLHGYGLQNVRTTLNKYHSVYAINYADGWFGFAVDLPNTLIS